MSQLTEESLSMEIWAHSMAYPVTALGPGRRIAFWVAGCSLGCRGCITPELWNRDAGTRWDTEILSRHLLSIRQPVTGITLTGGEPFEQAPALAELLELLAKKRPNWSTLVYSGYTLAALRRRGQGAASLLARTDVLVAGAFRADRPPTHPLSGSGNQRVHFLTERGRALRNAIDTLPSNQANLGLSLDGKGQWLIGIMDATTRVTIRSSE